MPGIPPDVVSNVGMSKDCGTCNSHDGLATDIRWLKKIIYGGFGLLVGVIVYFNTELHKSYTEINEGIAEINIALVEKGGRHETSLAKLEVVVSALDTYCCGELKDKE